MSDRKLEEKKVWFVARVQLVMTILLYAMNVLYFNKVILTVFTVFTVLSGLGYLYFYFTKRYDLWSVLMLVLVSLDFGFYVFNGGNHGAGILWSVALPFLAMYLRGYKVGSVISLAYLSALLVLIVAVYAFGFTMPYSATFLFVFFFVNSCVLVLLFKIERGRTLIQEDYDRIENLFTHATDLLFIGTTDGHFLTVNPSCTDVLGWSKDELLEKQFLEFVHPDDKKLSDIRNQELSLPDTAGYSVLENRFLCKDGSYKWLSWRTVYDSKKELVYAIARDITYKMEQEETLRQRALLQSIIVDISAEFINSTPENLGEKIKEMMGKIGQFLGYDRAYLIRLNKDATSTTGTFEWFRDGVSPLNGVFERYELSGHPLLRSWLLKFEKLYVYNVDDQADHSDLLGEMHLPKRIKSIFLLPLLKNGENVAILGFDAIRPTREITEDLIELLKVLAQLVTEVLLKNDADLSLREAAVKLDDLNTTKDKLFSIIAHDLRSPLSTIIGFTEMMMDDTADLTAPTMQEYSILLNQVALSTFDLLENLLDWSRLQRGVLKPEPTEILVDELVKNAIGPFFQKTESKGLLVNMMIESGLKANVDKRMLETVIRNLYTNAIKFTPEGGVITLKAERTREDRLMLCVSDTGIGIPEALLPSLFTANEDKNRQGLGGERSSGLGLMLCKEFMDIHQGFIRVQTAENKGSTFCINLPA